MEAATKSKDDHVLRLDTVAFGMTEPESNRAWGSVDEYCVGKDIKGGDEWL